MPRGLTPLNARCLAKMGGFSSFPAWTVMLDMGTKPRHRPENLGPKLLHIRHALGLSQSGMLRCLGAQGLFSAARISEYESGVREPSLLTLLAYATVARVHLEEIIDD